MEEGPKHRHLDSRRINGQGSNEPRGVTVRRGLAEQEPEFL
jgi:hypothetical protein